jgi:hypothetical protein
VSHLCCSNRCNCVCGCIVVSSQYWMLSGESTFWLAGRCVTSIGRGSRNHQRSHRRTEANVTRTNTLQSRCHTHMCPTKAACRHTNISATTQTIPSLCAAQTESRCTHTPTPTTIDLKAHLPQQDTRKIAQLPKPPSKRAQPPLRSSPEAAGSS